MSKRLEDFMDWFGELDLVSRSLYVMLGCALGIWLANWVGGP